VLGAGVLGGGEEIETPKHLYGTFAIPYEEIEAIEKALKGLSKKEQGIFWRGYWHHFWAEDRRRTRGILQKRWP
jgi:hypothetical protein